MYTFAVFVCAELMYRVIENRKSVFPGHYSRKLLVTRFFGAFCEVSRTLDGAPNTRGQ